MKKLLVTVFFVISSLLTSCVQKNIVDDINIVSGFGYDTHEDEKVKGTAIINVYKEDKSVSNESFEAIATQSKAIMRKLQQKSSDPLVSGSLEVVLFGKELAEKGIIQIVDTLERDPTIGSNLYLAVVDGKASKLLKEELGNQGTGSYLSTMLEHNMTRRELPQSNLHLFLFAYYSRVRDPFLPFIQLEDNKVNIKGVALFKDDKVVSYVADEDMFFFKALLLNFKNGTYTFKVEDEFVTTYNLTLKRDFEITNTLSDPNVDLEIKLEAHIREFSGKALDPDTIEKIEKAFEDLINKKAEELLKRFIEENIDPVGIGLLAKSQTRNFDYEKWQEVYPKAKINVNTNVIISETGVVE